MKKERDARPGVCVWCGWNTPSPCTVEAVKEHSEFCRENPLYGKYLRHLNAVEELKAELTAAREAIGVAREALEDSLDILDDLGDVVLEVMSVERVDGTYQRILSALSKLSELSKKEDGNG